MGLSSLRVEKEEGSLALEIPTYATIVLKLAAEIDLLTKSYTFNGYAHLVNQLKPVVASCCILYIVLMGFMVLSGKIELPVKLFQTMAIKIGLVYMLGMNWHYFSQYFVDIFFTASGEIGAVLMNANPLPMPSGVLGINSGLQTVLIEIIRVASWTWDKGTWHNIGPYFTSIIIYLAGYLVVGLAFFEIMIAKIMLSILMCTAPLFFLFTLFEKTNSFFDRWLGTLVGYSFVMILVSSVIGFAISLLHWSIGGHYLSKAIHITFTDWVPILFVAGLCVMAISEITKIAKSIGSSCAHAGASSMVGGMMGAVIGSSMKLSMPLRQAGSLAFNGTKRVMPNNINKYAEKIAEDMYTNGVRLMSKIKSNMRG